MCIRDSNDPSSSAWEPSDFSDMLNTFNTIHNIPQGASRVVMEWNKFLYFVSITSRPQSRGNKFLRALSLRDIQFRTNESELFGAIVFGEGADGSSAAFFTPHCLTTRASSGRAVVTATSLSDLSSGVVSEIACAPCEDHLEEEN